MSRPPVTAGQWITIGKPGHTDAVVCAVEVDTCEVVYLDERNRALNEDVKWVDDHWEFALQGPVAGYADKYDRLRQYVSILRTGRRW